MGVSKNKGTPKWMVYNGKPYFQMDDLGVPLFWETPIYHHIMVCLGVSLIDNWHPPEIKPTASDL